MAIQKNDMGLAEASIGGRTYLFEHWRIDASFEGLVTLMEYVGDGLGDALKAGSLTADTAGQAVAGLARSVSRSRVKAKTLLDQLVTRGVACNGQPIVDVNAHFGTNLMEYFQVAAANLEVQYVDFFNAARSLLRPSGQAQPAAKAP